MANNKKVHRLGEKHITNQGYTITIVEYFDKKNSTVQFEDGLLKHNVWYKSIVKGEVRNNFHKSKYGVGYLGLGKYKAKHNKKTTKEYNSWAGMLVRAYCENYHSRFPTYKEVTVCEEWHNFQNFAQWFEKNYIEGFELDKDILFKGNKIYSPETCCFVPQEINSLLTKTDAKRGNLPIGVKQRYQNKFEVAISKGKKDEYVGYFSTPEEAFQAYKVAKEEYIKEIADKWKDKINPKVYEALYNYQVEITD